MNYILNLVQIINPTSAGLMAQLLLFMSLHSYILESYYSLALLSQWQIFHTTAFIWHEVPSGQSLFSSVDLVSKTTKY